MPNNKMIELQRASAKAGVRFCFVQGKSVLPDFSETDTLGGNAEFDRNSVICNKREEKNNCERTMIFVKSA